MFGCNYRIYDNNEEQWCSISFAEFEDAENHVIHELEDADLERYSIYEKICGQ